MIKVKILTPSNRESNIVDETKTLYEILEEAHVAADGCSVSVNSRIVSDLNSTLKDLDCKDGTIVSTIVKANSAASVTVAGNAIVVKSTCALEDLKLVEKYRPQALCVFETNSNGESEMVFKLATTTEGGGFMQDCAAIFGDKTDANGKAMITMLYEGEDVIDLIEDKMGRGLIYLNTVEENIQRVVDEINAERETVYNIINIL